MISSISPMVMIRNIAFFLLFFLSLSTLGQEQDSLSDKPFRYLANKIDSLKFERGSDLSWIYLNAYIRNAKHMENHIALFYGYKSGSFHSSDKKLEYADSTLLAARIINDSIFIGNAYNLKAGIYYDYRQYAEALKYYLKAENTLKDEVDEKLKHNISYSIGVIKMYLGQFEEAKTIFEEARDYFQSVDDYNHQLMYLRSLYRLGEVNQLTDQRTQAVAINLTGLKEALNINQRYQEMYFNLAIGIDNYLAKDYELAIRHIQKSIPEIEGLGDFDVVEKARFYLGSSYAAMEQEDQALNNFQEVDSLFAKNDFLNPLARGSYEWLIDYYKTKDNKDKQLYYINQLLKADQINSENNQQLAYTLHKEYNTKRLLANKAQLERQFAYWRLYALGLISLLLISGLYFFIKYRKTKKEHKELHELYQELIHKKQEIKQPIRETPAEISKKQQIPEEVAEDILKRLERFEQNHEFLNPRTDLKYLADKFKTNTTYLSKIVNSQKKKNFSSYLNTLRVNFMIELLKKAPQYRLYTVQALAEHCGYTSRRQFSDAFYTETGIRPGYFVEQIQKEQLEIQN